MEIFGMDFISEFFGVSIVWWVSLLISGLCYIAVYIFQSIGLFTIAKREGYGNKWMAFVPFFNTYYIGVCGQKNRFFRLDTKKIAIAVAVLQAVLFVIFALETVSTIVVVPYLEELDGGLFFPTYFNDLHPQLVWARWCCDNLYWIELPLDIVYGLGLIAILNCFFQTYSARRYFIFTLACIFFTPVQGILIFAVRNNAGMSYAEYIRGVQERVYRQYRNQQDFYQNPYNQNPYSNSQSPYGSEPPQNGGGASDPFEGFGSESGSSGDADPFDEFKN